MTKEIKQCASCKKQDETVRQRTVKENGMLRYYDVEVKWCDKCVESHNHYLLSSWGN